MLTAVFLIALVCAVLLGHGYLYTRTAERQYPPVGKFAEIDGTRLHYLELNPEASSRPLLLIHGASCNLLDMKAALGDLSADRHVVLVDRPGCGYSSRPANGSKLTVQAALIAGLLKELKVEQPVVVAQSFGTAVALSLALHHSERIAGLVLLAPVSHRWPGGVDWYNHAGTSPLFGHFFRHALIPLYGRLAGRKAVETAFWPRQQPDGYFDKAAMPLIFRSETFKANAEDIKGLYAQVTEMEQQYQRLEVPVRMLAGTHDAVVLSTIHGMGLERKIEGATLKYVPFTGHPIHHFAFPEIRNELAELELRLDQ